MMIQSTSLEAYNHATKSLGDRQRQVLEALIKAGPLTNREISKLIDREINTVTPRVKELRMRGLVQNAGHKIDETGRRAIKWIAAYPQELFANV